METALEVLSRAASAVATDEEAAEVALHQGDAYSSGPAKELPSRINRQRRSAERRELAQALHHDTSNHQSTSNLASTSTKSAATQTIISTVRHEANEFVGIPSLNPAFPPPSSSSLLSHIPPVSPAAVHPAFVFDMRQHHRPSVINRAPSSPRERAEHQDGAARDNRQTGLRVTGASNSHSEKPAEVCDEIEEHFRRSLGDHYQEERRAEDASKSPCDALLTPPSSATLPRVSPPLVISGSVDDHFAKALGDKWSRIRTEMGPSQHTPASPPNTPSPAALTSQVFKHASFVSS